MNWGTLQDGHQRSGDGTWPRATPAALLAKAGSPLRSALAVQIRLTLSEAGTKFVSRMLLAYDFCQFTGQF